MQLSLSHTILSTFFRSSVECIHSTRSCIPAISPRYEFIYIGFEFTNELLLISPRLSYAVMRQLNVASPEIGSTDESDAAILFVAR
eukprot:scaffold48346_cov59-Cyclotella_meneghiniana.AAC.1